MDTNKKVISMLILLFMANPSFAAKTTLDRKAYIECQKFLMGDKVPPPEAEATCLGPAQYGVPTAQYALGMILFSHKKPREGVQWLEKAAEAGHPPALYQLAEMYTRSNESNLQSRGKEYFRRAACTGFPPAQKYQDRFSSTPQCVDAISKSFDGTWEGELHWVKSLFDREAIRLRVVISEGKVSVYHGSKDKWEEVKANKFKVSQQDETLIVSTLDSGWDEDGKWIESWTIQLLRVAQNEAVMNFIRTVNNVHTPEFTGLKTFTTIAEGRGLRRNEF